MTKAKGMDVQKQDEGGEGETLSEVGKRFFDGHGGVEKRRVGLRDRRQGESADLAPPGTEVDSSGRVDWTIVKNQNFIAVTQPTSIHYPLSTSMQSGGFDGTYNLVVNPLIGFSLCSSLEIQIHSDARR